MATRKQLEANRCNALKSTGPRTPKGKAQSRRNAITHGLTAQDVVLAHEDPAKFEALSEELRERFKPRDALEEELVGRIAGLLWRLRRIPVFEAALLDDLQQTAAKKMTSDPIAALLAQRINDLTPQVTYQSNQPSEMHCLARGVEIFLQNNLTSKLSTYEVRLQRQLQMTLKELNELQSERVHDTTPLEAEAKT